MNNTVETQKSVTGTIEKPETKVSEERLSMLIQSIGLDNENTPKLSEEQVTKLLNQKDKTLDYIHADKKQSSYDEKYYFTFTIGLLFVIFLLVIIKKPDYLSQLLGIVSGFIGGTGLGYKLGKPNNQ